MVILPPRRNPWVDLSQQLGQGMTQFAQMAMQREQMDRMNRLAEIQAQRQAMSEQLQAAQTLKVLQLLAAQQKQEEAMNAPSPWGTIKQGIPGGFTGTEDYIPVPPTEQKMPINWQQIKLLGGPSLEKMIQGGQLVPMEGQAKSPEEVGETATQKDYLAWKKIPGNEAKTLADYMTWHAGLSKTQETSKERDFADYVKKGGIDVSTPEKWRAAYDKWATMNAATYGGIRFDIAGLPKPTTTPGVTYSPTKGWEETLPDGTVRKLTSTEVQDRNLAYRELIPAERTKTMQQMAPKVIDLANKVKTDLTNQISNLGPLAGRWNEFMTGRIGAPNPGFAKLRTDVGLLYTLLMTMHTGARSSNLMMAHFKDLFDSGKMAPENMQAAVDAVIGYAEDVKKPHFGAGSEPVPISKGKEMILKNGKKIIVEE
jgi:hypothetical protein